MRSLLRGPAGALIVLGLASVGTRPADLTAQDKKDTAPGKKDENAVEVPTCDGLRLTALWYPGADADKSRPDAVLMFPVMGSKVTDSWVALAKALREKNFSVLLMDWRGCGMNAADPKVISDKDQFWKEPYNQKLLKPSQKTIEAKGLDYKTLKGKADGNWRYTDFMMNDLLAARFYLDRQNDEKKCDSGRIWIVTEKEGGEVALGFIASEFGRHAVYDKIPRPLVPGQQFRSAALDFVGVVCLSFAATHATGEAFYNNGLRLLPKLAQREAIDFIQHRLALVLLYGWKEGVNPSRGALTLVGADADPEAMKKDYKYLIEVNNSKATGPAAGIGLIDATDSFGAKTEVRKVMVELSKAASGRRNQLERDATKVDWIPRLDALTLGRR